MKHAFILVMGCLWYLYSLLTASQKVSGSVVTEKRFAAGENKGGDSGSLRKIDDSTDDFKHNTVDRNLRIAISQARQAKKMTQKDLARTINESAQTIQQYEAGTAIPNSQILVKLDKALGIRLPRAKK